MNPLAEQGLTFQYLTPTFVIEPVDGIAILLSFIADNGHQQKRETEPR